MSPELTVFTLAARLQVAQFFLMAVPTNLELPPGKTLSPRDRDQMGGGIQDQVSPRTARLIRAWENHFETLALFTIAVLVITLSNQSTPFTAACAWVYLAARIVYIPAYALGWVPWRSILWFVGFTATTLLLIAALL